MWEPAYRLLEWLRVGELSSRELLQAHIDRIEKTDDAVNAVVVRDFDRAMESARRADDHRARGGGTGALHGLPMTVKEAFDVAGLPTTWGFPDRRGNVAPFHAEAVQRLTDAGAIIFGKTNVPLNLADCQSYNDVYGVTSNPWDLSRTPGGSSGGSAAALAAGFTPLELGSDLGGSIRTPSAFCGVFGHKASHGIISSIGHSPSGPNPPSDISVPGPMARSAEDLRLAMNVLVAPPAHADPAWRIALPPSRASQLNAFRVAFLIDQERHEVSDEIVSELDKAATRLEGAGARVVRHPTPPFDLQKAFRSFAILSRSISIAQSPPEVLDAMAAEAATREPNDDSLAAAAMRAAALRHHEWLALDRQRFHYCRAWDRFFRDYDIILCPVHTTTAFPHDSSEPRESRKLVVNGREVSYDSYYFWMSLAGLSYLPATVVPVGCSSDGLPIGVQAIGPVYGDLTTIEFADLLAEISDPILYPAAPLSPTPSNSSKPQ